MQRISDAPMQSMAPHHLAGRGTAAAPESARQNTHGGGVAGRSYPNTATDLEKARHLLLHGRVVLVGAEGRGGVGLPSAHGLSELGRYWSV